MTFGRFDDAALIMGTLPFALTGGIWFLYLLGFNQSVATGVGFIALAGVSAEFGVVMLIYLKHALAELGPAPDTAQVEAAVRDGRPCAFVPRRLPSRGSSQEFFRSCSGGAPVRRSRSEEQRH